MGAFGEERDRDHALLMKLSSLFLMGLAHGQDLAFEDVFDHTCDATTMYATIRKADLAQLGTWKDNFEMVTLNEGCPGQEDEYGNIIFSAGSLQKLPLECGTQYVDDKDGKITFWNVVQYTPPNDSPITRDADGLYNFSCIYDMSVNGQEFELSLSHKIIAAPVDTIWFEGQTAEGQFRATMELFQDSDYENSFRGSAVTLSLEQRLYIDVSLEAADPEVLLKVIRCWATPSSHADAQIRHTLINEGCPTDETVRMNDSPDRNSARWESQMFQFVDESQVWLHCDIQACDSRKYQCETTCDNRRRRDIVEHEVFKLHKLNRRSVSEADQHKEQQYTANILAVGPMRSKERWVDESLTGDKETQTWIWISVIGFLVIAGLVAGIVYTCKMNRGTGANSKLSKNTNNDWQLYGTPPNAEKQNPLQQW